MNNRNHIKALLSVAIAICAAWPSHAFNSSKYATTSALSSGKWVKIEVEKTGMHQITPEQLAEMGFTDPTKVRIYGHGGYLIPDLLDGSALDDLQPVPTGCYNGKVYFYAKGLVNMTLSQSTTPRYTRTINHYANKACYFVTEATSANTVKDYYTTAIWGTNMRESSLDYYYHESELMSYSNSGRDLYGESIASGAKFTVPLVAPTQGKALTLQCAIAAKASATTYFKCTLNSDEVPFSTTATKVSAPSGFNTYTLNSDYASLTPGSSLPEQSTLSVSFDDPSAIGTAYLDYFIVTYYHDNNLNGRTQMHMGFNDLGTYDRVSIYNDSEALEVWDVADRQTPLRVPLRTRTELVHNDELDLDIEQTIKEFTYGNTGRAEFIAFDPSEDLYSISSYQAVDNQNIHGAPTPDYVIICPATLHEQAERLAQLHREHDGMDVMVVDQDQVFNEFSSGTPDASAYRLMMKMFYDRNPEKIKYLLMFGGGYFDNRQLLRTKGENYLLTFQSPVSYNTILTYVSDDFFGTLTDNTGNSLLNETVVLGIGRLPVITTEEATNVVDKVESYINDTDFSNWRNKMLIMDEAGDEDIHMYQGARLEDLIESTHAKNIDVKRLHIEAYTLSNSQPAKGANNANASTLQFANFLKEGLLFATYMGHGGYASFSKSQMWTTSDVMSTQITRLPIMTVAACDIANYDSNIRGIGEYMVITPNHGAIALLTSTRTVEASENDELNRAFIKELFTLNEDTNTPRTLGQAYMLAKQSFGTTSSRNKLCYTLFADPAITPSLPKPYINITKVNDNDASQDIVLKPMTKVTIEGNVCTANGDIDNEFNGDATISLYDAQMFFKTTNYNSTPLDIFNNRQLLVETSAKVVNGAFNATIVVPKDCKADSTALIKIYARNEANDKLVNGTIANAKFANYDEDDQETIIDTQAPTINKMYINNEDLFANNINVASNFTLHINVTDDLAIGNQSMTIGKQTSLTLDGNTFYDEVRGFCNISNEGTSMDISMPITMISEGPHTLKFTVYDAAGNSASRSISFIVVESQTSSAITADRDIATDKVTFSYNHNFSSQPDVKIYVLNSRREVVWSQTTTSSSCEWNLTDNSGKRVPAGVYQYFATGTTNAQSSGTEIKQLVIVDE
ncbi:MAG: type IX secretion system sortase PorU [Muribaculaceae bacterium]